jgi:hypothetical protein
MTNGLPLSLQLFIIKSVIMLPHCISSALHSFLSGAFAWLEGHPVDHTVYRNNREGNMTQHLILED